ncbi:MAG TPA: hypothetical protein VFE23_19785 [Usitatibacter sp.]|jgi:hypothetical protein|nr:hypothetical protein [Usitatibacter sp.]
MAGLSQERGGDPRDRRWRAWTTATLLAIASGAALAKGVSAPFTLSVTVFPAFKDVVDCGTRQQGAAVSLSCSAGSPAAGTSPRFLLNVYRDGAQVGTVEGSTVPGTLTSWKVVRIADRDFVEIVVGW